MFKEFRKWLTFLGYVAAAAGVFGLGVTMGSNSDEIARLQGELTKSANEIARLDTEYDRNIQSERDEFQRRLDEETASLTAQIDDMSAAHDSEIAALQEAHRTESDQVRRDLENRLRIAEDNARADEVRNCGAETRQQELLAMMVAVSERQTGACQTPEAFESIIRDATAAVPTPELEKARANLPEGVIILPRQDCVPSSRTFQLAELKTATHCESGALIGNITTLKGQMSIRIDGGDRTRLEVGSRLPIGDNGCAVALLGTDGNTVADLRIDC